MKTYQVYSLDATGGVCGDRVIEALNDEEALFAVRSMKRALDTEVWYRDRRIGRVPGHRPSA